MNNRDEHKVYIEMDFDKYQEIKETLNSLKVKRKVKGHPLGFFVNEATIKEYIEQEKDKNKLSVKNAMTYIKQKFSIESIMFVMITNISRWSKDIDGLE